MSKDKNNPDLPNDSQATQAPVKLTDITRGLYHAATSTSSMVANQYIHLLSQYFSQSPDGKYRAKTVEVEMPDESRVKVPLISMVSPKGLMLDKVNFDFSVVADPSSLADATTYLNEVDLTRSSFKVEMTTKGSKSNFWQKRRKQGVVDINMEFKAIEPPEGLMRLMDKFASIVTPFSTNSSTSRHLRLLSPKYLHIAKVLESNQDLASILAEFNALEYTVESFLKYGNDLSKWESELLKLSVEIDHEKNRLSESFEDTYEYARIAFHGTDDFDKLQLRKN